MLWTIRAYGQTRPQVTAGLTRLLIGLRVAALLLLLLALAGPVLSRLRISNRAAVCAVVLEDSGSMQIRDADGDTLQSRWSAALAMAARVDSVLGRLDPAVRTVMLRGNGIAPIRELAPRDTPPAEPSARGTDLENLRRQAADHLAGQPVAAMVMISDGQETNTRRGTRPGSGHRLAGKLFVIGVGDAAGPPDRLLKDLRYPDTAYVGDQITVEFAVDHRYLAGGKRMGPQRITARLTADGKPVAEKTVTSAEKLVPFVMSFSPAGEGVQTYELSVDTLDNERFPANNKASLAINVRRQRARVLLLAGMPDWDVRFLAQAAAEEQRVALSVVYPAQGGLVFADSLVPWVSPAAAAGWLAWDAVVLTGWTGELARLPWPALAQAVEQGLGLLVTAGSSSGPGGGPVPMPPPSGLADILPVGTDNWRWFQGPLFASVPAAAVSHSLLGGLGRASGAGGQMKGGLTTLPPLSQVAGVHPLPGSEVLLTAGKPGDTASAQARCLLAVGVRGRGRVVWFGGRPLWELAFWERAGQKPGGTDSQEHAGRHLLRDMLVWTVEGNTESGLELSGHQNSFQAGEPIRLGATWRDMRGQPVGARRLNLILRGGVADSLAERTYELRPAPDQPGSFAVELPPQPAGRYGIQLVGAGEPPVQGKREDLVVLDNDIEKTQVRMDRRRLTQLAASDGGRLYEAGVAADRQNLWADLGAVTWRGDRVELRRRLDIRSGWPLLVVVVILLGIEWYLRRRHGLL